MTTSFRIYSEATIEWEEWAVDDSCSDTEEHNDIPNDPWYIIPIINSYYNFFLLLLLYYYNFFIKLIYFILLFILYILSCLFIS